MTSASHQLADVAAHQRRKPIAGDISRPQTAGRSAPAARRQRTAGRPKVKMRSNRRSCISQLEKVQLRIGGDLHEPFVVALRLQLPDPGCLPVQPATAEAGQHRWPRLRRAGISRAGQHQTQGWHDRHRRGPSAYPGRRRRSSRPAGSCGRVGRADRAGRHRCLARGLAPQRLCRSVRAGRPGQQFIIAC